MKLKVDFANENITKLILRLAYPSIIAMLANASYNIIDGIYLGNFVGADALGATNAVLPIQTFYMAIATMGGVGIASVVSRYLGSKKEERALAFIGTSISGAILMGIVLLAAGFLLKDPLLSFAGTDPTIIGESTDYLYGILIGWLYYPLVVIGNNLLRCIGEAKKASSLMLISIFSNIILAPVFLLVFKMGTFGVGLSTSVSQGISLLLLLFYYKKKVFPFDINRKILKIDRSKLFHMYGLGFSSFLRQTLGSISILLYNRFLLMYGGVDYLNAMGIINKLYTLITLPIFGLLHGVQPVIGYNYGAQNFKRVKESVYKGALSCVLLSAMSMLLILVLADPILSLFTTDMVVKELAKYGLYFVFGALPLISFQMVGTAVYQSFGKVRTALFIAIIRQLVIAIPLLFILSSWLGIDGIWISFPISDVLSAIISVIIIEYGLRKIKRSWEQKVGG